MRTWPAPAALPKKPELVFVLAGRENRKRFALQLFEQGFAPGILLSVARFEIRRFSKMTLPAPLDLLAMASEIPAPQRHFFVEFIGSEVYVTRILPRRLGTLTEIEALGCWLAKHPEVRSVVCITSATHLCRVRMCCRAVLPPAVSVTLIAAPEEQPRTSERDSFASGRSFVRWAKELCKIVLYFMVFGLRWFGIQRKTEPSEP